MARHRRSIETLLFVLSALVVLTHRGTEVTAHGPLDGPDRLPTKCEVCKYLTVELEHRLDETGRSKEQIELGQILDRGERKKKINYHTSELRLVEAMDDICERILEYNVHAERDGSNRYAKGMSETFQTLHGLVNKGVKVELGIPYDMWDTPSAEVTVMKKQCESMLESHEEEIENWYYNLQGEKSLLKHFCEDTVLGKKETECLTETWKGRKGDTGDPEDPDGTKKKKKKKKGKKKNKKTEESETQNATAESESEDDKPETSEKPPVEGGLKHDSGEL
ncbi:protein canopy 4-like [Branchiostoma floridae x Branchiostoma belcheri]